METVNDKTTNDDNLDLVNFPDEKLKVIVELEHDNLRVSCEGPCDLDKWRKAYVTHWRRKLNNSQWKIETNNSFNRFLQVQIISSYREFPVEDLTKNLFRHQVFQFQKKDFQNKQFPQTLNVNKMTKPDGVEMNFFKVDR